MHARTGLTGMGRVTMTLPLIIRSNYYKGLLILSRRDRVIDDGERESLIRIGIMLDFDRRFCEAAIDDLLSNVYITRSPIVFSDESIKECFFRDALRVSFADGCLQTTELRWLRQVAHANGKSNQWLDAIIREYREMGDTWNDSAPFEIQKYL